MDTSAVAAPTAESGSNGATAPTTAMPLRRRSRHGINIHRALNQDYVSRSAFAETGVFGRLFPTLPFFEFRLDLLKKLDQKLLADSQEPQALGGGGPVNPTIPAGYTFLGQFIDHDITFDPTSSLERQNDPEAIHNFRTPLLELDNVYGAGPGASPFLYNQDDSDPNNEDKLLIGVDADGAPNDLPRNKQGTALIGDPRNDENLIVSQLHLIFLKFHNRVVDFVREQGVPSEDVFAEAQRIVRWHYQWLVVHEFLPRIVGQDLVDEILGVKPDVSAHSSSSSDGAANADGYMQPSNTLGTTGQSPIGNTLDTQLRYYVYKDDPYIPVEFAVAAYRFGHSMVRAGYSINATGGPDGNGFGALLFIGNPNLSIPTLLVDAGGQKVLNSGTAVDWDRFFEMNGPTTPPQGMMAAPDGFTPQASKMMDTKLSPSLFDLPGIPEPDAANPGQQLNRTQSLPLRNMLRGQTFRLPWGQRVAAAMGITPLTDDELGLVALGFPKGRAPLWYYILKEAELKRNGGTHLGPVGGRIVAEVLIGLLHGDAKSYISQDPNWTPWDNTPAALPMLEPGKFTVPDLIRFALGSA